MQAFSIAAGILFGAVMVSSAAQADEVWANRNTNVFWLENVGDYAVFEFSIEDAKIHRSGRIFLNGLVGTDTNRATFGGYWSSTDDARTCPMPIIDAQGNEAWTWGFVELTFNEPTFPSGWQAALGVCFDQAVEFWAVEPRPRRVESWMRSGGMPV